MSIIYGSSVASGAPTSNYSDSWYLVYTLDATGNIYNIDRADYPTSSRFGCRAITYAQLLAFKGGNWSEALFTSINNPKNRWILTKAANSTNLPLVLQTLLSGGNPGTYMTINGSYSVTIDTARSSIPNLGSNPFQFMHNNNGSEPGDIPTLGVSGGSVWSTGMYWGQIDAFSNYGGLMNSPIASIGGGGGNTGDRLLVYVR